MAPAVSGKRGNTRVALGDGALAAPIAGKHELSPFVGAYPQRAPALSGRQRGSQAWLSDGRCPLRTRRYTCYEDGIAAFRELVEQRAAGTMTPTTLQSSSTEGRIR